MNNEKKSLPTRVAVIGTGAAGLVTLKNLREVGLDAFAFERRAGVGGLWTFAEDTKVTSAVPTTVANVSKQGFCYTDFPYPDDTPTHPTQADVESYLNSYANHFSLFPHIRFGVNVLQIQRNPADTAWIIEYQEGDPEKAEICTVEVDKVVLAHGQHSKPNIPVIPGMGKFKGTVCHSQAYKRPKPFTNQRVVVVGCSNTAADTATTLVGYASEVYFSHRRGVRMLPRTFMGKPSDRNMKRRHNSVFGTLDSFIPTASEHLTNILAYGIERVTHSVDPKWGFSNPPSMCQYPPLVSDTLVSHMHAGNIVPVPGISKVVGDKELELTDGTHIVVDAIIFATGYRPNFSLTPFVNPSDFRLFKSIFPLTYSDSLAYVGFGVTLLSAPVQYDLSSQYVAQVFGGLTALPPLSEMESSVLDQLQWTLERSKRGAVAHLVFLAGPWLSYVSQQIGNDVPQKLGYGLEGWKYWWNDRELCNLLMGGVDSPHVYRLFEGDGKRKLWEGAREAIYKANGVPYVPPKVDTSPKAAPPPPKETTKAAASIDPKPSSRGYIRLSFGF